MTGYQLFRRRIAPVLFLALVALIFWDASKENERTHATIAIELGASAPDVRSVDAEVIVGGELVGTFHRAALPGSVIGPCRFETAMPEDHGQIRVEVQLAGRRRTIERAFRAIEGATVTVDLAGELAPRMASPSI